MNVLGLSASPRPWGNTDVLVRLALRGARDEGARTRFLRLGDVELRPCTGCLRCALRRRECRLDDGFPEIVAALRGADAVVLGSPTYVLGATGLLKNLQDRLIRYGHEREFRGRPGVALAAAGIPGCEPFALPQVSQVFLFLGMPVVDQFVGYAQGPGEILFAPATLERAREAGAALGRGETRFRGDPGACPECRFDLVTLRPDGGAWCPLCDLRGAWVEAGGGFRFEPAQGARSRWSEEGQRRHFEEKILPSRAAFRARAEEIRERLQALREGEPA